ncbi:MAG: NUDIX domain-containing protein [Patescibacteria group bacterium]
MTKKERKKIMNLCPRKSVGAIITDDEGKYLCLYRKGKDENDPTKGLAFVAGHLDWVDGEKTKLEYPKTALVREGEEEVGVKIRSARLALHETYPNPCGKGFDTHEWFVYWVTSYECQPINLEPGKHEWIRFLTAYEIAEFVGRGDCDPAWSKHIWPALDLA